MTESPARVRGSQDSHLALPRLLRWTPWWLIVVGLLVRILRQPTIAGTYEGRLDELLYAGQRLLQGQWLYDGLVNGSQPLTQLLYAPSAWLGGVMAHRLVILAVNLLGASLLAGALRRFGAAGLMLLRPDSLVPLLGGVLFLVLGQRFPGGLSGLPVHFASTFLVLALHGVSRLLPEQRPPSPRRDGAAEKATLTWVGAALGLAVACDRSLASPLLMVVVLVLLLVPRPLVRLVPLAAGGLAAAALAFLPSIVRPGGLALTWAGAVQLPLELAARRPLEGDRLLPLVGEVLATNVAGLPIWLLVAVPALGLLGLAARQWRQPLQQSQRLLWLPALAVVFLLELLLSLQRGDLEEGELQLVVLPLLLIMSCGFGELEERPRAIRRFARVVMVALLLILLNNAAVVSLLHPPRRPQAALRAVEADRAAARDYLAGLPPGERRFTAPQDVALQRQLGQPATTVGIGPQWSLNQQELTASWATRRLGLPTSPEGACRQLTDPANRHLVWMRTDPVGPNTEAFLRGCLERQPGQWQDISAELGLRSGEYRVFRRLATQPLPRPSVEPRSAAGAVQPSS